MATFVKVGNRNEELGGNGRWVHSASFIRRFYLSGTPNNIVEREASWSPSHFRMVCPSPWNCQIHLFSVKFVRLFQIASILRVTLPFRIPEASLSDIIWEGIWFFFDNSKVEIQVGHSLVNLFERSLEPMVVPHLCRKFPHALKFWGQLERSISQCNINLISISSTSSNGPPAVACILDLACKVMPDCRGFSEKLFINPSKLIEKLHRIIRIIWDVQVPHLCWM